MFKPTSASGTWRSYLTAWAVKKGKYQKAGGHFFIGRRSDVINTCGGQGRRHIAPHRQIFRVAQHFLFFLVFPLFIAFICVSGCQCDVAEPTACFVSAPDGWRIFFTPRLFHAVVERQKNGNQYVCQLTTTRTRNSTVQVLIGNPITWHLVK